MCEIMLSEAKYEDVFKNNRKKHEVAHADKGARKGRSARGQFFYYADRLKVDKIINDEHCMVLRIEDVFLIGVYSQHKADLKEKISTICGILEKIFKEETEPKIILAGDLNIKSEENNGADTEALEDILENYNMTIVSDKDIKT